MKDLLRHSYCIASQNIQERLNHHKVYHKQRVQCVYLRYGVYNSNAIIHKRHQNTLMIVFLLGRMDASKFDILWGVKMDSFLHAFLKQHLVIYIYFNTTSKLCLLLRVEIAKSSLHFFMYYRNINKIPQEYVSKTNIENCS